MEHYREIITMDEREVRGIEVRRVPQNPVVDLRGLLADLLSGIAGSNATLKSCGHGTYRFMDDSSRVYTTIVVVGNITCP